jgi:hypothetical protein
LGVSDKDAGALPAYQAEGNEWQQLHLRKMMLLPHLMQIEAMMKIKEG